MTNSKTKITDRYSYLGNTQREYFRLSELCHLKNGGCNNFAFYSLRKSLEQPLKGIKYYLAAIGVRLNILEEDKLLSPLDKVEKYLDDIGIRRLSYLGQGSFSLIFQTTDDKIVRIVDLEEVRKTECIDESDERPNLPQILQPISTHQIGDLQIEILPRVLNKEDIPSNRLDEVFAASEELISAIGKEGYIFGDSGYKNIGVMKDGTLVVIDGGAVRKASIDPSIEDVVVEETDWVSADGTWKQKQLYPEIETGELSGLISRENLQHAQQKMGSTDNVFTKAIEEDGFYPKHFVEMVAKASEEYVPGGDKGFCHLLEEQRRAMEMIAPPMTL